MFGEFTPAAPEIVLLTLICVVMIVDLFVADESRAVTFWLTIATLATTAWAIASTMPDGRTVIFDGSYVSDALSQVLKRGAGGLVAVGFLLVFDGVGTRNYPIVMGGVLVSTVLFALCTLVSDIITAKLDPRVRQSREWRPL